MKFILPSFPFLVPCLNKKQEYKVGTLFGFFNVYVLNPYSSNSLNGFKYGVHLPTDF